MYPVLGMKKNLFYVSQLTAFGNYVVIGLEDVKVYHNEAHERTNHARVETRVYLRIVG